ncbi:hypothetical protein AADG42_03705 [Ammonicoccus fulvus]|uniref:Uncharacterized protein n=1 Tax=Ammonicoccus fulvus TaxID=3138240 RepID=A0ABZ3FK79_9ACTN
MIEDVDAATASLRDLAEAGDPLAGQLARLVGVLAAEAGRNESFRRELATALSAAGELIPREGTPSSPPTPDALWPDGPPPPRTKKRAPEAAEAYAQEAVIPQPTPVETRRLRERSVLNPYAVMAELGESGLEQQLARLELDQLKDIVSEYGMNHDRRALTWKSPRRLIDRILAETSSGLHQGDAFRTARTLRR